MPGHRASEFSMAYEDRGEGEPVVLLHAFPLNGRMWATQVESLARSSWRCISPDYPGFGRSPHPPALPDVRYYAGCVGELLDKLGLERVTLAGLSMGGYVAFACMRLFPERVQALVLANTRPDPDSEDIKASRREMAQQVAEKGVAVLPDLQMERLLAPQNLQKNTALVESVRAMMLESSPDGVVAALSAMRERPDATDLLPKINVPTLVIGGAEDALSTPEIMAGMAEKISDARHVTLPGAGHLSNLEAPEEFNAALVEFLH